MIAPLLKKYAEENNLSFIETDIKNVSPEEIGTATMLPIVRWGDEQIEYDEVLKRISA